MRSIVLRVIFGHWEWYSMRPTMERVNNIVIILLAPWTARSIPELLSNLQKVPINFPTTKPVDQEVKNFLSGCL